MFIIRKIIDYFFVCRPLLLLPLWAYFIFGYVLGAATTGTAVRGTVVHVPVLHQPLSVILSFDVHTALLLLGFSMLLAGVYVLNQVVDMEVDRKNAGFPLVARGVISKTEALVITCVLFALPLVLSFFAGMKFAVLFAVACAIGVAYNMRPFNFKGRPVADFLSNAAGYGFVTFFLGWTCAGGAWGAGMVLHALPYFFFMAAGSLASTVPDVPGDSAEGKITFTVRFGIRASAVLGLVWLVCGAASAVYTGDMLAVVIFLCSFVPFIILIRKPRRELGYPAYQVGGGVLMLTALLLCPPLFCVSAALFAATRIYFWKRHGVRYPQVGS